MGVARRLGIFTVAGWRDFWRVGNAHDGTPRCAFLDQYSGGSGNDTLVFDEGIETAWGGAGNDFFFFTRGLAHADVVQDFSGAGAAEGDRFVFEGYGTAAQGASFTQLDAVHWQIRSADGLVTETIALGNAAPVHPSDVLFV